MPMKSHWEEAFKPAFHINKTLKNYQFALLLLFSTFFSACQQWTEEEKEMVYNDCLTTAVKLNYKKPEQHCQCVVATLQRKYPNPEEFAEIDIRSLGKIVTDCQDSLVGEAVIWPEKVKVAFKDSCLSFANAQHIQNPETYCNCVLQKAELSFSTTEELKQLTQTKMQEIGQSCLE